jgi:hypothetical protein
MSQDDAALQMSGPAVDPNANADGGADSHFPVRARLEDQIAECDAKSHENPRRLDEVEVCRIGGHA